MRQERVLAQLYFLHGNLLFPKMDIRLFPLCMGIYQTTIFIIFAQIVSTSGELTSPEVESIKQLYNRNFSDYYKNIRPRLNQSHVIEVNVSFHPVSLISFDTTEQNFVFIAYFILTWMDEVLPWDVNAYDGAESLLVPANQIWHPRLEYYKSFDGDGILGKEDSDLLTVLSTGQVEWFPMQLMSTMCDVSVKYYPFDKQVCQIYVNDAYLRMYQLTFNVANEVSTELVRPHSEWELLSVSVEKQVHLENDHFVVTYSLQRRSALAVYTLIAPLIVMGLLNVCLFLLPVTSGEKCSVAITLFLSYGVMMVVTSDIMPANSLDVSLLITYVFVLLLVSGFTVIFCILESKVQSSYGQSRIKVPRFPWLRETNKVSKINMSHQGEVKALDNDPEGIDSSVPRSSVSVENVLSSLDIVVFVVGLIGGVTYTISVLVTLTNK